MSLPILTTLEAYQRWRGTRAADVTVACVPTMGGLHEGHAALIRLAREHADEVVVSVFVNPTQFAPHEDYDAYPRTLDADTDLAAAAGATAVFAPDRSLIYGDEQQVATRVHTPPLDSVLCGVTRPHFFGGVLTVVLKLLMILRPDVACFGEKDWQQWVLIQRMVQDFFLPVRLLACPVQREADGLARSSRNIYLTPAQRRVAPALHHAMCQLRDRVQSATDWRPDTWQAEGMRYLAARGFAPEYLTLCHPWTLEPSQLTDTDVRIVAAAQLGPARLIDNLGFGCRKPSDPLS